MVKKFIIFLVIVGLAAVAGEISSVFFSHNAFNFKTFLMRFPAAASGYIIAKLVVLFTEYRENPLMVYLLPGILAFACAISLFFFF